MSLRHRFGPPILFVVLALIAAACASEDETATTTAPVTAVAPVTTTTTVSATTSTTPPPTTTVPATTSTTIPPHEPIGGTVTAGLAGEITTDNYWAYLGSQAVGYTGYLLGNSQPSLYTISVPDFLHIPVLATGPAPDLQREGESWTATIPIRNGYLWSDGTEVTANDFVFSVNVNGEFDLPFNWISNHPFKNFNNPETDADESLRWAERVEALDPHTVKITFAPSEEPPGLVVYQNGILFHAILSERFWSPIVDGCRIEPDPTACLFEADAGGQPSAGALTVESWTPGVDATLIANPNHYYRGVTYAVYDNLVFTQTGGAHELDETFNGEPGGQILSRYTDGPFVEQIRLIEYGSEEAAYHAFLRGEVDLVLNITGVPGDQRQRLENEPGVETTVNPHEGFGFLAINLRRGPMNDLAFRQAMAHIIDIEAILAAVPPGTALPTSTVIPSQNTAWHTPETNTWGRGIFPGAGLDAAVAALADAGYTWETAPVALQDDDGTYTEEYISGTGLTQPNGSPMPVVGLIIPALVPAALREEAARFIVEAAARLGIVIDYEPVEIPDWRARVFRLDPEAPDWDLYISGWAGGDPSLPCTSHQAFFGAAQDTVLFGGFNTPGYNNEEFEALSAAFDVATSVDEARELCHAMEVNISENLPYVVLFALPLVDAWRTTVEFPIIEVLGGIGGYPNGWLGQVKVRN